MGKIQELSEQLANQIAAGEVVERPASVVKELIENAIDAGGTQIDIMIEEAGLKTIQVIDNGEGISSEDVLIAFKRHATSKIHTRNDLFRIRSLGFRGEALPSIASVSQITIETSTEKETKGSFVELKGGKVETHRPCALRKGTKITVSNLFFNTPARLKYVKTIQTELANIGDIVNRLALSHPTIAFRLIHEGNRMINTVGTGDLKQTIAGIYGISIAKKMVKIEAQDLDFQLKGYISLPEVTRASRNYVSLIINGRYIKNFTLNKAIVSGYGSKLMVGRFPIAVLEITMDPLLVDVNVHPTKQEVRLSKEKELMTLISETIKQALNELQLIPNAVENLPSNRKKQLSNKPQQLEIPLTQSRTTKQSNRKPSNLTYDAVNGTFFVEDTFENNQSTFTNVSNSSEKNQVSEETYKYVTEKQEVDTTQVEVDQKMMVTDDKVGLSNNTQTENKQVENTTSTIEEVDIQRFPDLEYFGQMHGTYLFAQNQQGMYIIDQHAAQERINYEYFREKIGEVSNDLQELLVPIVLDYPANDALMIKEKKDTLEKVGIYLEDFGQYSFIVRSHPTWYPKGQEESTIMEMIDILLTTGQISVKQFRESTAIMMSCKRAIKANHYLNQQQAQALLDELKKCENPFNCPHGRPVLIHFTNSDMEKMFKRIQDSH